jgi:hypothetical protein
VENKFLGLGYNTGNGARKNFADQILPTEETGEDLHVRVDNAKEGMKKYYQNYVDRYSTEAQEVLLPKSYKVTLIADMAEPTPSGEPGSKARVLVWRIKSVRGRSEISIMNDSA